MKAKAMQESDAGDVFGKERTMKKGTMIVDRESGRMDIRFGLEEYYGGLHCGECLDVLIDGEWIPTRIEMDDGWYLVGIQTDQLAGLTVRI